MKTLKINFRIPFLAFFVLCIFSMLTFNSCEKDQPEISTTVGGDIDFRSEDAGDGDIDYSLADDLLSQIDYGAISVNEELGGLQFASDEALQTTLELLQEADALLTEEIVSSVNGLPEEDIDNLEIQDDYAFETFEANFPGFTSFRANAAASIEEFFLNEELDDENDPSDVYDAIPEVLGAILNTSGELMSSDGSELDVQVHIARLDGGNYTVLDGDMAAVNQIRDGISHDEITAMPNTEVVDEPEALGGFSCSSYRSHSETKYVNMNGRRYRAKAKVKVRNFSFLWWNIHRATSELESRRKKFWFWVKDYTTININQQGNVYPSTYTYYTCVQQRWNPDTQQWEDYVTTCVHENKCDGEAMSAAAAGGQFNWKYDRTRGYGSKVSASNKDGYNGTLRGTFNWRGTVFTVTIF